MEKCRIAVIQISRPTNALQYEIIKQALLNAVTDKDVTHVALALKCEGGEVITNAEKDHEAGFLRMQEKLACMSDQRFYVRNYAKTRKTAQWKTEQRRFRK
jgi:hypothetical protein